MVLDLIQKDFFHLVMRLVEMQWFLELIWVHQQRLMIEKKNILMLGEGPTQ